VEDSIAVLIERNVQYTADIVFSVRGGSHTDLTSERLQAFLGADTSGEAHKDDKMGARFVPSGGPSVTLAPIVLHIKRTRQRPGRPHLANQHPHPIASARLRCCHQKRSVLRTAAGGYGTNRFVTGVPGVRQKRV
jgi:hypothetical protein